MQSLTTLLLVDIRYSTDWMAITIGK